MNNVANEVFSHLQSGKTIQGDQLAFMLRILRSSIAVGLIAEDQYAEFASSGYYLHHLHRAFSDGHSEAVGECVFGYLEAVPDASEPDEFGSSNAGYENLTELLQDPDTVPSRCGPLHSANKGIPDSFRLSFRWRLSNGLFLNFWKRPLGHSSYPTKFRNLLNW